MSFEPCGEDATMRRKTTLLAQLGRGALVVALGAIGLTTDGAATAAETGTNIRGASTGPTTAKGYDHPEQSLTMKDVKPADNMYPVLQRPEQEKAAQEKLAALQK
jgi:hypothetical protein